MGRRGSNLVVRPPVRLDLPRETGWLVASPGRSATQPSRQRMLQPTADTPLDTPAGLPVSSHGGRAASYV